MFSVVFPSRQNAALPPRAKSADAAVAKMLAAGFVLEAVRRMSEKEPPFYTDEVAKMLALTILDRASDALSMTYGWSDWHAFQEACRSYRVGSGRKQARDEGGHVLTAVRDAYRRWTGGRWQDRDVLFRDAYPLTCAAVDAAAQIADARDAQHAACMLQNAVAHAECAISAEWEIAESNNLKPRPAANPAKGE